MNVWFALGVVLLATGGPRDVEHVGTVEIDSQATYKSSVECETATVRDFYSTHPEEARRYDLSAICREQRAT